VRRLLLEREVALLARAGADHWPLGWAVVFVVAALSFACGASFRDAPEPWKASGTKTPRTEAPGNDPQCGIDFEKRLMTRTPAMMSAMPAIAGASSDCRYTSQPASEISTMPTPDQIA